MEGQIRRIIWSEESRSDLQGIFEYYIKISIPTADKITNEIIAAAESITFNTQYQRDTFNPEFRRIVVRHYKILYEIQDYNIQIIAIVDTRQDPNSFKEKS